MTLKVFSIVFMLFTCSLFLFNISQAFLPKRRFHCMSAFCTRGCFVAYIYCLHFIFKYHASDAKIYCVFPSVQLIWPPPPCLYSWFDHLLPVCTVDLTTSSLFVQLIWPPPPCLYSWFDHLLPVCTVDLTTSSLFIQLIWPPPPCLYSWFDHLLPVCTVDLTTFFLFQTERSDYEDHSPIELTRANLHKIESVYDYMCLVSGDQCRKFLLSCGVGRLVHVCLLCHVQQQWVTSVILVCSAYTIQPCTLSHHLVQSLICRVHACLAVTCHLHFWQNDWDLLCANVVTWGWNGYQNKVIKVSTESWPWKKRRHIYLLHYFVMN